MFTPDGWISESPSIERFAEFMDGAVDRASLGE
jgi:hypothetical protein